MKNRVYNKLKKKNKIFIYKNKSFRGGNIRSTRSVRLSATLAILVVENGDDDGENEITHKVRIAAGYTG